MGDDELWDGTDRATEERYREVQRVTRRAARRQFPNLSPEDHDELVNDVLLKYHRAFGREEQPEHEGWIVRTVRTTGIDLIRRRKPGDIPGIEADALDALAVLLQPALGAQQFASLPVVQGDLRQRIFDLVNKDQARVLQMRYLDNLSAREVAAALGTTPAAVDQAVSRAKRALTAALEQHPELVEELRAAHPRVYPA